MFAPTDFCNLAAQLSSRSSDEASLRTSVSRSYYSVFLSAREKLDALGHYHPKGAGVDHSRVRGALASIGRRDLANKILGLYIRRGKADYDLNISVSQIQAQQAVQIANNLLSQIPSLT